MVRSNLKGNFYQWQQNGALACITATLLTDNEVILNNIPEIEDVKVLIEILKDTVVISLILIKTESLLSQI